MLPPLTKWFETCALGRGLCSEVFRLMVDGRTGHRFVDLCDTAALAAYKACSDHCPVCAEFLLSQVLPQELGDKVLDLGRSLGSWLLRWRRQQWTPFFLTPLFFSCAAALRPGMRFFTEYSGLTACPSSPFKCRVSLSFLELGWCIFYFVVHAAWDAEVGGLVFAL